MTDRIPGCYTPNESFTKVMGVTRNCQCEPCAEPVLVDCSDIEGTECVPILTEVIENCTVDKKQDAAYPDNIVFQTRNLPRSSNQTLSGNICIRSIELSYNCIGLVPDAATSDPGPGNPIPYANNTSVWVNSVENIFTVNQACTCTASSLETPDLEQTTPLFNETYGTIRTSLCCCNGRPQEYAQIKVVNKKLDFHVCGLNITVRGRIGDNEFIADSIGLYDEETSEITPFSNINPLPLSELGFSQLNFAERLCLPTDEQVKLSEVYDTALCIDCVQPVDRSYSVAEDPIGTATGVPADITTLYPNVSFLGSAEAGLFIKKSLFASMKKALAVLTSNAQINCQKQIPRCPCKPVNPCIGTDPCPPCIPVCGSGNPICPPIP